MSLRFIKGVSDWAANPRQHAVDPDDVQEDRRRTFSLCGRMVRVDINNAEFDPESKTPRPCTQCLVSVAKRNQEAQQ